MDKDAQISNSKLFVGRIKGLYLLLGLLAFIGCVIGSVTVGAANISLHTVADALLQYNVENTSHQIVNEVRIPRAIAGGLVGASLSVAGAIMQGLTRNPLADPGLLGTNAGAGFALVCGYAFLPGMSLHGLFLLSFLGAALGTGIVYGIGMVTRGGLSHIKIVIAGAAISTLLVALSEGIAIHNKLSQDIAFWNAGGLVGTQWIQVKILLPWTLIGIMGALFISRWLNVLNLGEEIATGLGQKVRFVKLVSIFIIVILAGASVATVGQISFVGLVIPHIARFLVGADFRWLIAFSAVMGGLLMVIADVGARVINSPFETPIGSLIALFSIPFFLFLVRRSGRNL